MVDVSCMTTCIAMNTVTTPLSSLSVDKRAIERIGDASFFPTAPSRELSLRNLQTWKKEPLVCWSELADDRVARRVWWQ